MIEELSNYAFTLILSSFLMNIIQMILPNTNNKKYILFVCSMIIIIILITPMISFLNKDFEISDVIARSKDKYIEVDEAVTSNYYESEVISTYKEILENDIIETLNNAGYEVLNMNLEYDKDTLEPNYLKIELKHSDGTVRPVRIEVIADNNLKEDSIEALKVKKLIKSRYEISNLEVSVWKSY